MRFRPLLAICFCSLFTWVSAAQGAMDPVEIEEIKGKAPIYLTGHVVNDELFQDISDEAHHSQIRVMTVKIQEVHRAPEEEVLLDSVDVFYTYIPTWQSYLYAGGSRADIAVGDVIEVWLEQGRKISVTLSNIVEDNELQLNLFSSKKPKQRALGYTMDAIRAKYGSASLLRAVSYTEAGTARHRSKLVGGHKS